MPDPIRLRVAASEEAVELQSASGSLAVEAVSPRVSFEKVEGGTRLDITDVDGTKSTVLPDGATGPAGATGPQGPKGDKGDKGDAGAAGAKVFSICNNVRAIVDGVNATFGSNEAWGSMDATYSYIGRRNASSNYQATAKIHAIRIYNRHLSEAEILHNQRIDNVRYKLGLLI